MYLLKIACFEYEQNLVTDVKERRGYSHLKEEALDRTEGGTQAEGV